MKKVLLLMLMLMISVLTVHAAENVALPATASFGGGMKSYQEAYDISNVVDGDYESMFWSSAKQVKGQYILLTLENPASINNIKLHFCDRDHPQAADVQISGDNTNWRTLASFKATDLLSDYTYTCSGLNQTAKYVRLYLTVENTDKWLQMAEFEVYGTTEGEKPVTVHNGHEYVDLGLSVMWATCNVGATSPVECGDYFAWGETSSTIKSDYSWSTYKYCNGSYTTLTKYCTNSSYGTVDNKTVLESADDAATVHWGGDWRTPTYAELDELCTKCTWTMDTLNGVAGVEVKGANGNSIFLPYAGHYLNKYLSDQRQGYYLSSSLSRDGDNKVSILKIRHSDPKIEHSAGRHWAHSVRPVVCPATYLITAVAGIGGITTGSGQYIENTTVTLIATPDAGYTFAGWNDGNHDNPRIVTATKDVTYTATFNPIHVESVTLDVSVMEMYVGESQQLTATIAPSDALNKNIVWESNNPSIAIVADGLVTGIAMGETTVTVTSEDGSKIATCTVMVDEPITALDLRVERIALYPDERYIINTNIIPANVRPALYTWSTEDDNVATVVDGIVMAHNPGKTTITLAARDNDLSASCEVTVVSEDIANNVLVETSDHSVLFTWETVANAHKYQFAIYRDEAHTDLACTVTCNAWGQLIDITFPRKKAAAQPTLGILLQFTIGGLDSGTQYHFTMNGYTEDESIVMSEANTFITTSNTTTDVTSGVVRDAESDVQKVFENGIIYIIRNDEKYTVDGRKVE